MDNPYFTALQDGLNLLLIEQGRHARPGVPKRLRSCTCCHNGDTGDERQCVFNCPRIGGL